jgi:hypothetical protein
MGLPLDLNSEGDEIWEASDSSGKKGWKRFGLEAFVCLRLRRLAHYSMQSGAAVAFG